MNTLARSLTKLLGPGIVRDDSATLATHATDRWFASRKPDVVVLAKTHAHVDATLAFVNKRAQRKEPST